MVADAFVTGARTDEGRRRRFCRFRQSLVGRARLVVVAGKPARPRFLQGGFGSERYGWKAEREQANQGAAHRRDPLFPLPNSLSVGRRHCNHLPLAASRSRRVSANPDRQAGGTITPDPTVWVRQLAAHRKPREYTNQQILSEAVW